jgi:signal transduction histidine kinase
MPTMPLTPICPQCRQTVEATDAYCPNCGANLALVAALAEREVLAAMPAPSGAPFVADVILPRFGEYLVQSGAITNAQLQAALTEQTRRVRRGAAASIGQVLIEMGYITREQLERTSIQQVKELQAALQDSNRQLEERVARRTQELQQALQKLTELNQLKANFVANISHELRTPLVPIKSYAELMLDGGLGPLTDEQKQSLEAMTRSIGRLEGLVNNLIQFASSLTGDMLLVQAPHAVTDLVTLTLKASEAKALKKPVRLQTQLIAPLPLVLADGEKIHWVLFQLVDNAIKFTPPEGTVTLTAEPRVTSVRLSVRDTGIGIPPERLPELFQPFHQLDGTSTRQYGGTGLGLALVKRILDAHGSQARVESKPGEGSTFWFDLPIAMS